jgi:hypothetical protein
VGEAGSALRRDDDGILRSASSIISSPRVTPRTPPKTSGVERAGAGKTGGTALRRDDDRHLPRRPVDHLVAQHDGASHSATLRCEVGVRIEDQLCMVVVGLTWCVKPVRRLIWSGCSTICRRNQCGRAARDSAETVHIADLEIGTVDGLKVVRPARLSGCA